MTKIKSIYIENLKAIGKQECEMNGKSIIITAGNNRGKTTFSTLLIERLQSIRPSVILKEGEHEGIYKMEFTNGTRIEWPVNDTNKKGDSLNDIKYFTQDDIKMSVTKDLANSLFPSLFDVDKFLSDTPKEQQKALQALAGLDFDDIDFRYKAAFENRTDKNRDVKRAEAVLKKIDKSLPEEEADIIEIQKEIASIDTHNEKYDTGVKGLEIIVVKKSANEKEIKRLQGLIKALETDNKALDKRTKEGEFWIANKDNQRKDDEYSFNINKKLQDTIDNNKKIVENNKAIADKKAFDDLVKEADILDGKVKAIQKEKEDLIKTAKLPEEFGFGEDGILYNGLPFTKEQQSLSSLYTAALKLAFLGIGKVRMIHFDASPLTNASLEPVLKWAEQNDLQLFVERPDIINDGDFQYQIIDKTAE